MKKSKMIIMRVTPDEHEWVRECAENEEKTISEYIWTCHEAWQVEIENKNNKTNNGKETL